MFLPYCSQDLWTGKGNTTSPAGSAAPGFYFSGWYWLPPLRRGTLKAAAAAARAQRACMHAAGVQPVRSWRRNPQHANEHACAHAGHLILSAVADELAALHGMDAATEIVLSGESAGGFGVYHNVDWLQTRFPSARVLGAPIAGYEFYAW